MGGLAAAGRMAAPALLYSPMLSRPPCRRATRGRSLIEVLTAMGISTILLATAVPNLQGMRAPWVLRQTAGQVAAEFQKARMRAIARGQRIRFSYDATAKTYTIDREVTAGTWVVESNGALPTSASITAPVTTPIFDTRGMLNQTATIPVNVTNYSKTRTVNINVLGNVTIS